MKRIFSFLLAALLLVSAVPMAQATNDYTAGTQVTYDATADNDGDGQPDNTEAYTVTVPAKLAPGGSGTVTLQGTWAADRYITVTSSQEIEMVNDINSADKKTLAITFDGIGKRGSNTTAQTVTEQISVADFDSKPLFGEWSGLIEYNVDIETRIVDLAGTTWQMNNHVSDDDNILGGGSQNGGTQTATVSVDGQVLNVRFENFEKNELGVAYHYWFNKGQGTMFTAYVPNTVAQNFGKNGGWFLISCDVNKAFSDGEASLIDVANTAQECSAPLISFLEIENDYLHRLDIIDWLYDNAVMQ